MKLFSIYLMEMDNGLIKVIHDWNGKGDKVADLGCSILSELANSQVDNQNNFYIAGSIDTHKMN